MEQYIAKVTEIMREADQLFETTGGGTRHYVRDLLLPMMEQAGLKIVDAAPSPAKAEQEGPVLPLEDAIYEKALKDYLEDGIEYGANTIRNADVDDLKQLASDSFYQGAYYAVKRSPDLLPSTTPPVKEAGQPVEVDLLDFILNKTSQKPQIVGPGVFYRTSQVKHILEDFISFTKAGNVIMMEREEAAQPAPSGLRWIRITTKDSLPPDGSGPNPKKYIVQYQVSNSNGEYPEYCVDLLTAAEIANECQGCDWFEWLSDFPAPVQVDPELIEAYKEYVKLLGEEIDSMFSLAHIHGWRSERHEKGIELRYKIQSLLPKP